MTKPIAKKKSAAPAPANYPGLVGGIGELLDAARRASVRTVNAFMTATYWEIGRRIVEFEQGGEKRAEYGDALLERLSQDLTAKFGRGFARPNLIRFRQFYQTFPTPRIRATASNEFSAPHQICSTVSNELPTASISETPSRKLQTPSAPFNLTDLARAFPIPWSHYVLLISRSRSPEAFAFYHTEALRGGWSVRQFQRQMDSQFYERTALSRNKAAMLAKARNPSPATPSVPTTKSAIRSSSNSSTCATNIPRPTSKPASSSTSKPSCSNSATTSPSSAASAGCASTTTGIAWTCSSSTAACAASSSLI